MNMIRRFTLAATVLAASLFGLASQASAQLTVTQTTTASAVTLTATSVNLTSSTGVLANSEIFVDREAMLVTAVTGNLVSVNRGYDGTYRAAHASGMTVYAGPSTAVVGVGSPFVMADPPFGSCNTTDFTYSLWINPVKGYVWRCANSEWVTVNNPVKQGPAVGPHLGAVIASAATIAPTTFLTHVSGTTTIATITVPPGCELTCQIALVPDGLWATSTGGNISLASTAVVNKVLILTWDGTKWNPSY